MSSSKPFLGPPPKFSEVATPKPQHFKKEPTTSSSSSTIEVKSDENLGQHHNNTAIDIPIIRKPSSQPELRKLKVSRPSFDPTEGVDFESFASKKEAFLMGYLNALYHRLDGVKKVK